MSNKITITLDSSQISTYLECPRYWHYSNQRSIIPVEIRSRTAMDQGTLGHLLLENYYKLIMNHTKPIDALAATLSLDVDDMICATCKERKEFHSNQDHPYIPLPNKLEKADREIVREKIQLYVYTYSHNDFIPQIMEVGFTEQIYEDDEFIFVLEGRIDMLASYNNLDIFVDHKFQGRKYELYKKSIQFRNYSLASHRHTMMINYVRFTKGVTEETFQRPLVSFTTQEHIWWKNELIKIFKRVAHSIINNHIEQNWSNCKGSFGYHCMYSPLCEEMDQEHIKEAKIKQNYTHKEPFRVW